MSSVTYEGKKVNSSIHDLKALSGRFPGVASRVQGLTSAMVSCRGFNHIGSGVTSTSFSSEINNSASELDGFVSKVRNMQVKILSYSNYQNPCACPNISKKPPEPRPPPLPALQGNVLQTDTKPYRTHRIILEKHLHLPSANYPGKRPDPLSYSPYST